MKFFSMLLGVAVSLACGSREAPPANTGPSSSGVEAVTDTPNAGPDFSPTQPDGTFSSPAATAKAADAGPASPNAGASGTWQNVTGGTGGTAGATGSP